MSKKYTPTEWVANKTVATADVMNNIEQGIVDSHQDIEILDSQIKEIENQMGCVDTSGLSVFSNKNINFDDLNKTFNYTNDNTDLLQTIINKSKVVYIPKGNYFISKPLKITKSVLIISNGANFYCNPKTTNSSAFEILADNVTIYDINVISKDIYSPKIGTNNVTGKSSNIYGFLIRGNNCKLKSCNTFNCFSLAYIRGYDETYDGTDTKIINNITIENSNGYDTVFGVFTAFVDNVNINNLIINNNETGLNDYCHNIYIGTQSANITFNNIALGGGTDSMYDVISLHDSITNSMNIKNIQFINCKSTSKARNFITLADCDTVNVSGCSHINMDLNYQKGLINTSHEARNITIKDSKFKLYNAYSLINSTDGGENVDGFEIINCDFDLKDTNYYVFRYMRSVRIIKCNFNLTSSSEKRVTLFYNDSSQVDFLKNIRFIDCNIIGDDNTIIDNIVVCNSNYEDDILIDKCDIVNKIRDTRVIDLQKKYSKVIVMNSNFYGYNEIHDTSKELIKFNVNVK